MPCDQFGGHLHRHLVGLPQVAHVDLVAQDDLVRRNPSSSILAAASRAISSKIACMTRGIGLGATRHVGAVDVVAGVGGDEPHGGEDPGVEGDDHPGYAQLLSHADGVDGGRAPRDHQAEVAGIVAALNGHDAHGADHVGVHEPIDAVGGLGHALCPAGRRLLA